MTTGQRIKEARKRAGVTQVELGALLGVSGSMIAQYETDKRNPKQETIQRIAVALNVPILELMGIDQQMDSALFKLSSRPKDNPNATLTTNIMSASEMYNSLSLEGKMAFIDNMINPLHAKLNLYFDDLNPTGQEIAVERVRELGRIPEYQREQPETPPELPSPTSGGKDTPTPENPAERPQEGE